MEVIMRPLRAEEVKYTYSNSHQINMNTGLIGYIRMDMGQGGNEFWTTWWESRADLNTADFRTEVDDMINSYRKDGYFLSSRSALAQFCLSKKVLPFDTGRDYGVRVDSDKYAYLMRLNPFKGEYNMYCYCYIKGWLDHHIENAKHGISIRDANMGYKEIFRLDDGDKVIIRYADGSFDNNNGLRDCAQSFVCRYINDTHFECGDVLYHIDQFAEVMSLYGNTVIPLRASLPDKAYAYIESDNTIGVVEKGESGYKRMDFSFRNKEDALERVNANNQKLGISRRQAEAMKCGSMFGWHTPAADPRNYDDNGFPIKPMSKGA